MPDIRGRRDISRRQTRRQPGSFDTRAAAGGEGGRFYGVADEAGLALVVGDSLVMGEPVDMGVSMGARVGRRVVTGDVGDAVVPLPHATAKPRVSTAPISMKSFFTEQSPPRETRQKGGRLERP